MVMAASVTSSLSSTFSSLSLRRFSLLPSNPKPSCLSLSAPKSLSFKPIKCQSPDSDTVYFLDEDPVEFIKYDPPEVPEDTEEFAEPSIDDELEETPEQIAEAYEKLYGEDIFLGEEEQDPFALGTTAREKFDDEFEEQLVQVRRVTKVVKGGKQLHFRALVVVGDKQGKVGVGVARATEVADAVEKSAIDARRNLVKVPMTKYLTFPHRANGKHGAATVMLRPAAPGSGVNAGGAVRVVLEMAGIQNALGKQLRSKNPINNARATIDAILRMRTHKEVAAERGIPMEQLWR